MGQVTQSDDKHSTLMFQIINDARKQHIVNAFFLLLIKKTFCTHICPGYGLEPLSTIGRNAQVENSWRERGYPYILLIQKHSRLLQITDLLGKCHYYHILLKMFKYISTLSNVNLTYMHTLINIVLLRYLPSQALCMGKLLITY